MSFCTLEKKKTELYQDLGLQARDLRFQHLTSITARNNAIIIRMEVWSCFIMMLYYYEVLKLFLIRKGVGCTLKSSLKCPASTGK